jgi:hypothetical protein
MTSEATFKRDLLIGLVDAQNAMIEKYATDGPTTDTLAALYLCELAALPVEKKSIEEKDCEDDGTTGTVTVKTFAAWDMFVADMLATIAMELGYRGQAARWPVWLRESNVHLTGEQFMALRKEWFLWTVGWDPGIASRPNNTSGNRSGRMEWQRSKI